MRIPFRYLAISPSRYLFAPVLLIIPAAIAHSQEILTLPRAIETGLKNNYSIILKKNDALVASNDNTLGNAGFLPSVSLNATGNRTITKTNQKPFSGSEKTLSNAQNTTFNAGAQLNWTLFDGMQMFVSKKMLNVMEEMGENETRLQVETTVRDIILNYYGIIQLKKMIGVLREAADLSLQRKKIAEAKLSLGSGSQLMLLQSTVDLNADSNRLIIQLTSFENAKADLNQLLARDPETLFDIHDSIILNTTLLYDSLVRKARLQNTQLIVSRLNRDLSHLSVRDAQSYRYPALNFTAGYTYNRLNSQTGYLEYNQSYGPSFGITASYNLFNGFNVNRNIKNAKINFNSAETDQMNTDLTLRTSLWKLYTGYLASLHIIRLQNTNVEIAAENVKVAFEKYKLGTINDVELREIQQKLIDAQYQLILSQFEAKRDEAELLMLCGDLYKSIRQYWIEE